jgi:hypothetical protein
MESRKILIKPIYKDQINQDKKKMEALNSPSLGSFQSIKYGKIQAAISKKQLALQ